jgi:transcriptional regulator with XRE-family HTH domain
MTLDHNRKHLGSMIRTARLNTQLSIYQLGQITGVGSSAISAVENGDKWPDEHVWECICMTIGLPLAMLQTLKSGVQAPVRVIIDSSASSNIVGQTSDAKVVDLAKFREKKWQTSLFPTD